MPDIVTFDGPNKVITEIAGPDPNELDVVEIYSEWKDWVKLSDNAKYLAAFAQVGGDPISPTQNLGTTFFLENGWRLRPAEADHKLTLIGNIFTREAGESVFLSTIGAFTVNTETRVSNLVDSSVSRLDLNQLLQAVYVAAGGAAGTGDENGTPTNPSGNMTDARLIADARNLQGYVIRGSFTLLENTTEWRFEGNTAVFNDVINVGGFSVNNSRFIDLTLTGAMTGRIDAERCNIEILTGFDGIMRRCGLNQDITVAAGSECTLDSCYSTVAGGGTPILTFTANAEMNLRNYSGGVQVNDFGATNIASFDLDPGHLILDSSCTGGTLLVRGLGRITRNDAGAVTVLDFGFLPAKEMQIVHDAIAGNATVSLDDQTVTIRDADNNVVRVLSVSADGRVRAITA